MSFAETKQLLLQQYYSLDSEKLPQQREFYEWKPENNFGFLLGLISYGEDTHITQLHSLLHNNQFKEQEQSLIDSMFDYYIRPFHKDFNDSYSCQSPSVSIRRRRKSAEEEKDLDCVSEEKELFYEDLKDAVLERDGACLFCWIMLSLDCANIISQKNIPYDEQSILLRAGLTKKHQVQNGLLLCKICHSEFDELKRYVDVVDDKLVIKVVNETNDVPTDKRRSWEAIVGYMKVLRSCWQTQWADSRQALEPNGEMDLYFVKTNATKLPNRTALAFHKTACLIWKMAGGAAADKQCCWDDDEPCPVNTAMLRKRYKIPAEHGQ